MSGHDVSRLQMLWAVAWSAPAVFIDIRRRQIPNSVCAALLGGALVLAAVSEGLRGLGFSLLGAFAGLAVFLIFYLGNGMGGGDVKLMAGYGALLGVRDTLTAALIAAAAGAVIALVPLAAAGFRARPRTSIPYGPAIAFGALMVLLSRLVEAR